MNISTPPWYKIFFRPHLSTKRMANAAVTTFTAPRMAFEYSEDSAPKPRDRKKTGA
ncbi:hypothetical protein Mapa_014594 [Marchantia paleacea]|nr:hypothetical protein Mapa_014594 [Marchantia paleacea]